MTRPRGPSISSRLVSPSAIRSPRPPDDAGGGRVRRRRNPDARPAVADLDRHPVVVDAGREVDRIALLETGVQHGVGHELAHDDAHVLGALGRQVGLEPADPGSRPGWCMDARRHARGPRLPRRSDGRPHGPVLPAWRARNRMMSPGPLRRGRSHVSPGRAEREWGEEGSNLRRRSRRFYRPLPLTARASPPGSKPGKGSRRPQPPQGARGASVLRPRSRSDRPRRARSGSRRRRASGRSCAGGGRRPASGAPCARRR